MKYVANVGLWFGRGFLVILLFLLPASIYMTIGLSSETYIRISQSIILIDSLQKQASSVLKTTNQLADGSPATNSSGTLELLSQMINQSSDHNYEKTLIDHEKLAKDYDNLQSSTQAIYQFQDLDNSGEGQLSGTAMMALKAITIARMSLLITTILLILAIAGLYAAIHDVTKFLRILAKSLIKVGIILVVYAAAIFILIKMHFLSMIMSSAEVRSLEDMLSQYSLTGVQINLVVGIVYIAIAIAFFKLARQILENQKTKDILNDHQPALMYNKKHD